MIEKMKPYFVIVLFISMFLGKAQEQRTIKNIDEINLTEERDKNFQNYQKALGKNTLKLVGANDPEIQKEARELYEVLGGGEKFTKAYLGI